MGCVEEVTVVLINRSCDIIEKILFDKVVR